VSFDGHVGLLLGNIAKKRFPLLRLCYRSVACLSVMFVHRAQTTEDINMISFAYGSPCLFQIAL